MQNCSTEPGENILTLEDSDEVLERAATVFASGAVTVAYCTFWYECGWPSLEPECDLNLRLA